MLTVARSAVVTVLALLAVLLVPAPATASTDTARSGKLCVHVRATGVGQDLGGGNTIATIYRHGVVLGTTAASFTITGFDGPVASFVGPLVFTGRGGTLTVQLAGTLDTTTGMFDSRSTSITGTGVYRWVSGTLRLVGVENLQTGAFTETITGRLCVPRRR